MKKTTQRTLRIQRETLAHLINPPSILDADRLRQVIGGVETTISANITCKQQDTLAG